MSSTFLDEYQATIDQMSTEDLIDHCDSLADETLSLAPAERRSVPEGADGDIHRMSGNAMRMLAVTMKEVASRLEFHYVKGDYL